MKLRIDVYHHNCDTSPEDSPVLREILERIKTMAVDLSRVLASTERLEDAEASVIELLTEIAQIIRDTPANQEAINALADRIDAMADAAAAAVVANTDVDPTPPTP